MLGSLHFSCFCCRWESMGSPHRLAWYWLQVLEKWTEERVKLLLTYLVPTRYVRQLVNTPPPFPGFS